MATRYHSTQCIIWVGNQPITAWNDGKTSPKFLVKHEDGNTSASGHAEGRALQKAGNADLKNARVYVMRFLASGNLSMAKPCKHCEYLLLSRGIKPRNIRYTQEDGSWQKLKS